MELRSLICTLPVLLLAAMAIGLPVNAADQNSTGQINGTWHYPVPEHYIPPEYFRDAKPVTPLPETEMMTFILSERSLRSFSQDDQAVIVTIPVSYLNGSTHVTVSTTWTNRFVENGIGPDDAVVLVRMPSSMFDRFIAESKDGTISLPSQYFARRYASLASLEAGFRPEGGMMSTQDPAPLPPAPGQGGIAGTDPLTAGIIDLLRSPQGTNPWYVTTVFFGRE